MGGFDSAVLVAVGLGAIVGLARGFVHETLSLLAWVASLFAIRFGHPALTLVLERWVGTEIGAEVIAFALLLAVPYFAVRTLARWAGGVSRNSVLGPIDRVLGLGFGGIKGLVLVVLAFSLMMLGYDTVWGARGRPEWITRAHAYPIVNAASNALVTLLAERRAAAADAQAAPSESSMPTDAPVSARPHRHARHAPR